MGCSKCQAPGVFLLSIAVGVKPLRMLPRDAGLEWDFSQRSCHFMRGTVMLTVYQVGHPFFNNLAK